MVREHKPPTIIEVVAFLLRKLIEKKCVDKNHVASIQSNDADWKKKAKLEK